MAGSCILCTGTCTEYAVNTKDLLPGDNQAVNLFLVIRLLISGEDKTPVPKVSGKDKISTSKVVSQQKFVSAV